MSHPVCHADFMKTFSGIFGIVVGIPLLFVFWPVGLIFLVLGFRDLNAADAENCVLYSIPEKIRCMEFGPSGPPWADEEHPIPCEAGTIFSSAIRSINEWGAAAPDVRVSGTVRRTCPESARPACVEVVLHSGETHTFTGPDADRLRTWFAKCPEVGSSQ
jgi:hypothetical protein